MTALAELAAFDTLDAKTIDRLLAQHLVETFAVHAAPDDPVAYATRAPTTRSPAATRASGLRAAPLS